MMSARRQGLPWNQEEADRRRLRLIAAVVSPLFLFVAVYVSWVDLPEQTREEKETLPPQLARIILEKKEPPKPVIKPKKKEPEPKPEPKPEVAKKPEPKPEPKPKIVNKPKPEPKPEEVAKAREKASKSGVLAMSNELSKLSALADTVQLDTPKTVTAKPIARKTTDTLAAKASTKTRSAGVDETQLSTETRQVALAERQRTQVEAPQETVAAVEAEERAAEKARSQRTKEEIRRTMDANKAAIYSIYNRALRRKPSLRGRITPELVIEESGAVSSCEVVDSTLNEPKLESKICRRLQLVNFGPEPGVDKTKIRYPIELLPS
ncbi:AgmX/PglI C-terminal domain-containing protein [Marinobacteraceae bacterium S3BR75-40.1]